MRRDSSTYSTKPNKSLPQKMTEENNVQRPRLLHRLAEVVRRNPIKSVAAAAGAAFIGYHLTKSEPENDSKKKVLVLPFHRMKIVEHQKKDWKSLVQNRLESKLGDDGNAPIEMEVDELVQLIHTAASDPNIVALYGVFGHGFGFQTGGWAHIEEIRNALQVFRESHRTHREPNLQHDPVLKRHGNGTPKLLYAYADTFASPLGMGKEYYLASAFTHVQLQPQGDLHLFGLHTTNTFLKDALGKYGIKVHIFKHGVYKNFANQFSENRYTKDHRENVRNIIESINQHVCYGIYHSRNLSSFEFSNFWRMVHRAGSFPAHISQKIGFVDYLPRLDPLDQLVASNKSEEDKQKMKSKWGKETDMDHFAAESTISVSDYATQQSKRKEQEDFKWNLYKNLKTYADSNKGFRYLLTTLGYGAPYFNVPESDFSDQKARGLEEKIAVIKLNGAITDATARKMEKALRKLKKTTDVKCVVIRVDSPGGAITACETIYQLIQDLDQKVVVSFGNVSASGGYYISTGADRIFASPTTITGSIGVFMIRLDLRELAAQYGIKFDSVSTSVLVRT
jgi:ClpP class serine protease